MKDKKVTKKIVLIGDAGVGKTSIVRRFVTGLFNPAYIITLGTTIMKKEIEYIDTIVNLAIWDIGGQSVFKAVRSKYYFASEGALAICDRCNRKTIENLPSWIDSFREVVGDKPVIIVGNKSDLPNLEVSEDEIYDRYDIGPGDLYSMIETLDWLLYSLKELAKLIKSSDTITKKIDELRIRVKYGVKSELVSLVRLKGIGRVRARMLYNHGIRSIEDLSKVNTSSLLKIPGIGEKLAKSIKSQIGKNRSILDYL